MRYVIQFAAFRRLFPVEVLGAQEFQMGIEDAVLLVAEVFMTPHLVRRPNGVDPDPRTRCPWEDASPRAFRFAGSSHP